MGFRLTGPTLEGNEVSAVIRTILVPLDGSPEAEAALLHAGSLATRLEARVLLVRPLHVRGLPSEDIEAKRLCQTATARAELHHATLLLRTQFPTLDIGVAVPLGPSPDSILDEVRAASADLVVCAMRFGGDPAHVCIGRIQEGLSERSEVPVILVPPRARMWDELAATGRPWRVVAPLDGSPAAEAVLPLVVQLGVRLNARVTILHVLKHDAVLDDPREVTQWTAPWTKTRYEHHVQRRLTWVTAAAYCRRIVAWIERHGVRADLEIRTGNVVEEVALAAMDRADLVAMSFAEGTSWKAGALPREIVRAVARGGTPVLLARSHRAEPGVLHEMDWPNARAGTTPEEHANHQAPVGTGTGSLPAMYVKG
jgi:nucleotide-binding universal stress UspA family protein